ncbi:MAG: twin-arginine translocation pathway signal [Proteobacteria bacterium ST_bin14]|nr:MAG: twin-arginine translocation pathway signal [Proteobacteria bacterium ST_bin14]
MSFNRRDLLQGSGAAAMAAMLPGTAFGATGADSAATALLEKTAETIFDDYPEAAAGLGLDKGKRAALKSRLSNRGPAGKADATHRARTVLAKLNKIDTATLSPAVRTNVEVVRTAYQRATEGYALPYGDVATLTSGWRNSPYAVAQNVGAYLDIPQLLNVDHRIDTPADADAYLARMIAYAGQIDGEAERVRAAGAMGVRLPDFALAQCLKQLEIARSGPVEQWSIVTSLAERTAKMPGDFAARAARIATDKIAPALAGQIAALEGQKAATTSDAGMWKLPQGDAYYAWALQAATTTTMTPDEVHAMGRDELARLHARMDVILKAEGYTQGSVGARMTALSKDPRYLFAEGDPGRAEIMAYLRDKLKDIRARMPQAFETLVPGFVEVTRMSPAAEPGAPGAYGGAGSIDGKEPGRFWINLGSTSRWTRYSLPDLAYHEAIPGHAWQGEYTFKQPLIRTLMSFNAYSEGWGLYAEQLADELGVYDDFPAGRLGYLQSLAFRACRMVVDTGIHAKRWTRDEGIAFFVTENGSNPLEVRSEVERYCTWPGQACGYKLGHSRINQLRDKAKAALGERYDFRKFNDAVVLGGNVPMTVLDGVIDRHIAARKA